MRTVRIFISSPSDASRERDRLTRVARRLNSIYSEAVQFEIVRWEDDFYRAHETFQTQIPEAKTCDIVIGILKHRLGSPLPSSFPNMPENDPFFGEPYPSGTAYEILSSIASRILEGSDKPDIYVFRDAEPPMVSLGSGDVERIGQEWRRLEDFARRFFFTAEGDFRFAFQTFRSANQFEEQIDALLRKWIENNVFAEHRSSWPVHIKGSPFRALDVFDTDHRDVFFGRDRDTARIVDLLAETASEARIEGSGRLPFLLVTGPSGAGKSSLLRAGLVPSLTASDIAETEQWRAAVMTPSATGKGPFHALATALLGNLQEKPVAPGEKRSELAALPELRDGAFATADALGSLLSHGDASAALVVLDALRRVEKSLTRKETFDRPPTVRLLLVVDQLDEIFSSEVEAKDRSTFAKLLAALCRSGQIWIVASLRASLYESFLSEPDFFALRNAGATYELGPPGTTELADIVRKPAQAADIVFEKDSASGRMLDEVLLADFDRPDMLPLLQFTLEALFQRRETRDGVMTLTHSAYRNMNGIAGAVETAAAAAMAKVTDAERSKLPKLLRRLVTTGLAGDGEAAPLILHDVPAARLENDREALRLAEALTEARLLVAGGSSAETRTFRLAHQRLLTLWDAAEAALRDNATFYRVSGELEQARARWQRNGRKRAQLIRDPALLSEAARLAKSYPDEIPEESIDFIGRSRWRARMGTVALGTVAATFAVLFAGTIWLYQRASRAEESASIEKFKAETNYGTASNTIRSVISDLVDGLKNTEGVTAENRMKILGSVKNSLQMLQAISGENADLLETRVLMFNAFGDAYWGIGDAEHALGAYRQSIALDRELLQRDDKPGSQEIERGIAVSFEHIGDILVGQGNRAEAMKAYQESFDIRQRLLAANPGSAILRRDASVSLDRIAQARQASGDFKGAMEAYSAGAENTRALLKNAPENRQARRDLSVSLEHIADLQVIMGDRNSAKALYDEILTLRRSLSASAPNDNEASSDLLVALLRQGDFALAGGDRPKARQFYEEILERLRRLTAIDGGRIDWQRTMAIVLNNLADIAVADGDAPSARQKYDEALGISRRLSGLDLKNVQFRSDIVYELNRIADLLRRQGRDRQAIDYYMQAADIARILASTDEKQLNLQHDLEYCLTRVGRTRSALGDLDGALQAFMESQAIAEKLAAAAPSNITWQNDVVVALRDVGDTRFFKGDMAQARASYTRSVDILKPLVGQNPDRKDWQRDLAVTINKVGDTHAAAGEFKQAGEAYQSSLDIIVSLLKQDPANNGLLRDKAYGLGKLGAMAQQLKDPAKAIESYRQALDIAHTLAQSAAGNTPLIQSDVVFTLLNLASLQTGAEKLTSLKEAQAIAEKLAAANLLTPQQKNWPDLIRAQIAAATP